MVKLWVAVAATVVVAVGLWAFQPWRVFTSSEVDEAPPASSVAPERSPAPGEPATGSSDDPSSEPTTDPSDDPATEPTPRDRVLSVGAFEDAEHGTSGTARILQLADGRRFVRLEDLASSDGPDLHVWLTDQPSGGGWGSYDDGRYVRLGGLKATHGNQNYEIPADADLDGMRSVVIWCDRFNVAFGTAPVTLG